MCESHLRKGSELRREISTPPYDQASHTSMAPQSPKQCLSISQRFSTVQRSKCPRPTDKISGPIYFSHISCQQCISFRSKRCQIRPYLEQQLSNFTDHSDVFIVRNIPRHRKLRSCLWQQRPHETCLVRGVMLQVKIWLFLLIQFAVRPTLLSL